LTFSGCTVVQPEFVMGVFKMSAIVDSVTPGTIAEELEIEKGDEVISINGESFTDALDYGFLCADEYLELCIKKKNGETIIYEIEKDEYEDLGINFSSSLIDAPRSCRNKCIFCFIDQLPCGLRKTLYFKDDDTRLSFLTGNYVTLTNIDESEIDKIIRLRLSPINVSVHTTDDELRKKMLNNKNAGGILDKIKKLTEGGITVNCQIVLVKGVNDGDYLLRSLRDLAEFYPMMHSVSVVPVGISDHREGLYPLSGFTREDAAEITALLEKLQQEFLKKYGSRTVYIADEFYIKAGIPVPSPEVYEDFPQIENGVGMISTFMDEVEKSLEENKKASSHIRTVITGKCSYSYIRKAADMIEEKFKNVKIHVIAAENKLFGEKITVSGLLCGRDILDAFSNAPESDGLIIPRDSLRAEGDMFLDDMTKEEFIKKAGLPVFFAASDGSDFVSLCIGE